MGAIAGYAVRAAFRRDILQEAYGSVEVFEDEPRHDIARLADAGLSQFIEVVSETGRHYGEIAEGLELHEIAPGPEEIDLAYVVADIVGASRDLSGLEILQNVVKEIIAAVDFGKGPASAGLSDLPVTGSEDVAGIAVGHIVCRRVVFPYSPARLAVDRKDIVKVCRIRSYVVFRRQVLRRRQAGLGLEIKELIAGGKGRSGR